MTDLDVLEKEMKKQMKKQSSDLKKLAKNARKERKEATKVARKNEAVAKKDAAATARKAATGNWVQPRRVLGAASKLTVAAEAAKKAEAPAAPPSWASVFERPTATKEPPIVVERRSLVAKAVQPGGAGGCGIGPLAGAPSAHALPDKGGSRNATPRQTRAGAHNSLSLAPPSPADDKTPASTTARAPPARPRSACSCNSAAAMGAKGAGASSSGHASPQMKSAHGPEGSEPPEPEPPDQANAFSQLARPRPVGPGAGRRSGEVPRPPPAERPKAALEHDVLTKLQFEPGGLAPSSACSLGAALQHSLGGGAYGGGGTYGGVGAYGGSSSHHNSPAAQREQGLHQLTQAQQALLTGASPHAAALAHGIDMSNMRGAPPPPGGAPGAAPFYQTSNAFAEVVHSRRQSSLERVGAHAGPMGAGLVVGASAGGGATDFSSACGVSGFAEAVAAHLRGSRGDDGAGVGGVGAEAPTSASHPYRIPQPGRAASNAHANGYAAAQAAANNGYAAAQMFMERHMSGGSCHSSPSTLAAKATSGMSGAHSSERLVSNGSSSNLVGGGGASQHWDPAQQRAGGTPNAQSARAASRGTAAASPASSHRPPPQPPNFHAAHAAHAASQAQQMHMANQAQRHALDQHRYNVEANMEAVAEAMRRGPGQDRLSAPERAAQAAAISSALSSQMALNAQLVMAESHHRRPPVETALRRRYTEAAPAAAYAASSHPHLARTAKSSGLQYSSSRPWNGGRQ